MAPDTVVPIIREATTKDWPILKKFLVKKMPLSVSILPLIDITDKFKISRKIYVTSSDPTLFIFATQMHTQLPCFCTFWDIDRTTKEEAFEYLKSIPNWKWNEKFYLFRIQTIFANYIDKMIFQEGLSPHSLQREPIEICYVFEWNPENFPEEKLPSGFRLGELKPHHADFILSKWTFGEGEDAADYGQRIRNLPTSAAYRENDPEQENPVSWSVTFNHGSFGMTYTLPEFRRKGLATAVEINLCKKIKKANLVASADVEMGNKESVALHKKAGFKIIGEIAYAMYFPAEN